MIYLEQAQTVDVQRESPILLRETPLEKGDERALRWSITVMAGKDPADLSGMTAQLYIARRGEQETGPTVFDPDAAAISDNVITAILPQDAAAISGQVVCLMRLREGDRAITVARMGLWVADTVGTDVTLPASGGITFDEALSLIKAAEDAAKAANAAAARAEGAVSGAENAADAANAAAGKANAAAGNADTAAGKANTAAGNADTAAGKANTAAGKIDKMTTAATALPAGSAPTVQATDDGSKIHIDFGIPRGSTGPTGPQGKTGATPRITFTVETGDPGTQVVVTQSGTAENPVVNLRIPRGVDGKGSVSAVKLGETTHSPDGAGVVDLGDIETPLSDGTPEALGKTAAPGTSMQAARGDHVHPLPTAAQVGARPASWTPSAADVGARPANWMPSAAEVGAYPAGAVRTAQISIAASAWAGSGPYNTVLRIAGVTAQTDCRFDLGATLTVLAADVAWETGAGTITMTTTKKPTGELAGRVILMEVAT